MNRFNEHGKQHSTWARCGGMLAAAAALWGCQVADGEAPESEAPGDVPVEVYSETPQSSVTAAGTGAQSQALIGTESATWRYPFNATSWKIDFNIQNSYLSSQWSSCFNTWMSNITHAGEDWAGSTGQSVAAIGDGTVVYSAYANYPGYVIVIEHPLTSGQRAALGVSSSSIYSMYGHLNQPYVGAGASVTAAQVIGSLLNQGSNTHLHWEVRDFDISTLCGTWYPGPGYTGVGTDARSYGYLDPTSSVAALQSAPSGGCTCYEGLDFDHRPVDPADTHCGFRVCGTTYTLFECGSSGWTNLGTSCGSGCTCYEGIDSSGRNVDPADTHCGYRVCGLDDQYYDCGSSGWVASGETCW